VSLYLERLRAMAVAHGGHPAVEEPGRTVTYAEFFALARRYAAAIARARASARVMIHLTPGVDAYAAMFGAGFAGAVYAPVNIAQPLPKRRIIAAGFAPEILIGDAATAAELGLEGCAVIDPADPGDDEGDDAPKPHDLAYVIFTSGSTGTPKGVAIGRDALDHYVGWIGDAIRPTTVDRWSQHPNIGFDLSVLDIYGALCFGATLVPLLTPTDRLMPGQAVAKYRLTIWDSVPSILDLMIKAGQLTGETMATLRLATFCGEPLRREHLDALFAARPDLLVFNTYGPTEATVSCTLRRIREADVETVSGVSVALGDAIPGMDVTLEGGPDADEGEIVLAGPQLARGYWHDEDTTARSFHPVPDRRGRVYRTGDWAKRRGGELFFAERIDNQIKIKGNRLDLAEVDAAISRCGVLAACCVFHDGMLHAFIQRAPGGVSSDAALREALAEYLEPHAIPGRFHQVENLPRNDNDKIDRGALRARLRSGAAVAAGADR
jgi:D-alanine--poly(phosphoribitol) ligase subunit 1